MKKLIIIAAVAATVSACGLPDTHVGSRPTTGGITAKAEVGAPLESDPVDPYKSTGTWLVPDEIAPGTYRVALAAGKSHGYSAVCGDYECEPFGNMISNENYSGPGVLVVPSSAVSVELKNLVLTPMGVG